MVHGPSSSPNYFLVFGLLSVTIVLMFEGIRFIPLKLPHSSLDYSFIQWCHFTQPPRGCKLVNACLTLSYVQLLIHNLNMTDI